ncbi:hypothetical protein ACIGXA_33585 [Streptomyces fildesensis]|uniref:Uncharacterized protein n=1 Tax=Streptomyces fildesensis TaxID=375757 RepID=A0ABW8CH95_9ACTN
MTITPAVETGTVASTSRGVIPVLLLGGLAMWFVGTAASQHPNGVFDRVRNHDKVGLLLPNWRFFAPEPAQHDFHVLHRVLTADGSQTRWEQTTSIAPRRWTQMVWFPDRRREKGLFDVCAELISLMNIPGLDTTGFPVFRVLRDFVALAVHEEYAGQELPQGLQFVIARHTGHDQDHEPDYIFLSPFVPLRKAESVPAEGAA